MADWMSPYCDGGFVSSNPRPLEQLRGREDDRPCECHAVPQSLCLQQQGRGADQDPGVRITDLFLCVVA